MYLAGIWQYMSRDYFYIFIYVGKFLKVFFIIIIVLSWHVPFPPQPLMNFCFRWTSAITIQMAPVFQEIDISLEELRFVIEKIVRMFSEIDLPDQPALVFQLLRLSAKVSNSYLFFIYWYNKMTDLWLCDMWLQRIGYISFSSCSWLLWFIHFCCMSQMF